MQTLLTSAQMRKADEFTIENKPITSINLMELAAQAFVEKFIRDEPDATKHIAVFCGKGNNGGDGLAIARLLIKEGFKNIKIYIINFSDKQSPDFTANLKRLQALEFNVILIDKAADLRHAEMDLIIDAILGSGLNKPLTGNYAELAESVNKLKRKIYAVDVPTGFPAEGIIPSVYNGIRASKTICFQRPKINFFFPESAPATETFEVVPIGLDEDFIQKQMSNFLLVQESDVKNTLKPRKLFSHKGTYGHALIIAGHPGTMGAALLCTMASLHTGAGLTTACIPQSGLTALNTLLPEVMFLPRDEYTRIEHSSKYQAIAIGPGLGISPENEKLIEHLFLSNQPLVIDADALNILGQNPDLICKIPENSILTPHMKEFDRLFGSHSNWWSRLQTAREKAQSLKLIIVLKNQFTFICSPDGKVYINPTGNPAMAQGGMGDVLTGVIAGFISQQYAPVEAAILACYMHGKAGDCLSVSRSVVHASVVAQRISVEIKKYN